VRFVKKTKIMKKSIYLFLVLVFNSFIHFSQGFNHNVSIGAGILNAKVRVQYEKSFRDRASFGANLNYYFANWKGPVLEPFARIYGKKDGNAEGFFGEAKLVAGNLSTLNFDENSYAISNKRWSTFGFGVDFGYKFLIKDHFTIEPLFGFRLISPPIYKYNDGYDQTMVFAEGAAWYLTTGFPLNFNLKFGYQF
jgi:hypothetical protein